MAAGGHGGAAGELRDGRAAFFPGHDGGGEVVAEEQLVLGAQQVVLAVSPGRFGVGAGPAFGGRGPGEGLQAGPVHRERGAGVLELPGDGCLQQVVAGRLQRRGGLPAGLAGGERGGDQAEGALGLPVGEQVRAAAPVRDHAEPDLVVWGQAVSAWWTRVRCAGRPSAWVRHMPASRVRTLSCRGRTPVGQSGLDPRRDAGCVDDLLERCQGDHAAGRPRAAGRRRPRRLAPARRPGRPAAGSS